MLLVEDSKLRVIRIWREAKFSGEHLLMTCTLLHWPGSIPIRYSTQTMAPELI